MRVAVNDANILIDLVKLELLPPFFSLEFRFATVDIFWIDCLHGPEENERTQKIIMDLL
jgi:hypothetical protein